MMNQTGTTATRKIPSRAHYEFTLAEFPISLLSKKPPENLTKLEYRDVIEGRDGMPVERIWKAFPSAAHGFGGPTTISTLFELFQIWKEDGFQERNIKFGSIYNLVQRKFLKGPNKQIYAMIIRDLEALAHMTFDSVNSFWDNEKKAYVDIKGFKLFDYLALYKDRPDGDPVLPFSYIRTSEILWDSANKQSFFPVGIDRKLFHSFKPMEQRLALYLEKVFRSQEVHRRKVKALAEQLPIQSKAYKHTKLTLKRTCEGLLEKGYDRLERFEFEKPARGKGENIAFHRSKKPKPEEDRPFPKLPKHPDLMAEAEYYADEILEVCKDPHSKPYYTILAAHVLQEYKSADLIFRSLGETKEIMREGNIRVTPGACFLATIKRFLTEDGKQMPTRGSRSRSE